MHSLTRAGELGETPAKALPAEPPCPAALRDETAAGSSALHVVVGVALALVALAVVLSNRSGAPAPESAGGAQARVMVGAAEVITDSNGRVTQVLGPDPRSVLVAYCRTGRLQGRFEALDVAPSPLDPKGTRVGLLRDPHEGTPTLAITILADLEANRWVAGDGRTPLEPLPAPDGAEAALRRR